VRIGRALADREVTTAQDPPAGDPGAPGLDQVAQKYPGVSGGEGGEPEGNCDRRGSRRSRRRYEAAGSMDAAGYGYGRNSNSRRPASADSYVECAEISNPPGGRTVPLKGSMVVLSC